MARKVRVEFAGACYQVIDRGNYGRDLFTGKCSWALARAFRVRWDCLPPLRSAAEKVCLASAMKVLTSVSNAWLARRLQMGKTSSIGALVRRFRLRGRTEAAEFKQVLSQFTT